MLDHPVMYVIHNVQSDALECRMHKRGGKLAERSELQRQQDRVHEHVGMGM